MSLNIFVRSVLISFLVAVPSPFVIDWIAGLVTENQQIVIFVSIYLLAFVGCLVMGICGRRDGEAVVGGAGADKSSGGADQREAGVVKWFNVSKGFGFITRETGEDVFVHYRSIRGEGRKILRDGQQVRFSVSQGEKGLQADDVSTVRNS